MNTPTRLRSVKTTRSKRTSSGLTYRAYFEDTGDVLYSGMPSGNLVGDLPCGTWPEASGECGTLDRHPSLGDPFEKARFRTPSGRIVIIEREGAE